VDVRTKRVYESVSTDDGTRVLVDRLWPRGVRKGDAALDHWCRDVAPSAALRKWFGHDATRFEEFSSLYRAELDDRPAAVAQLLRIAGSGPLTLLYAARDPDCNHARVLAEYLRQYPSTASRR